MQENGRYRTCLMFPACFSGNYAVVCHVVEHNDLTTQIHSVTLTSVTRIHTCTVDKGCKGAGRVYTHRLRNASVCKLH